MPLGPSTLRREQVRLPAIRPACLRAFEEREPPVLRPARMKFAPQLEQEHREMRGRPADRMNAHVARPAQRHQARGGMHARPPMVHYDRPERAAAAALATVATQHGFALAAEALT